MFEIGNSLREARLRQGVDFPRVEADTKIRAKYLRALEEERFEVLPAETYVKGFLRSYAEYLGLDGQLYVDEFNSRFARTEEPLLAPSSASRPRPRAVESNFVVVALAGIVAVTILVVIAWRVGTDGAETAREPFNLPPPPTTTAQAPTTTEAAPRAGARPAKARLVLIAARGDCWISVKAGSATGELLFEGTLQEGQTMRFVRRQLWIELGAAGNLNARLNGRPVKNFPAEPSTIRVRPTGIRILSTV